MFFSNENDFSYFILKKLKVLSFYVIASHLKNILYESYTEQKSLIQYLSFCSRNKFKTLAKYFYKITSLFNAKKKCSKMLKPDIQKDLRSSNIKIISLHCFS